MITTTIKCNILNTVLVVLKNLCQYYLKKYIILILNFNSTNHFDVKGLVVVRYLPRRQKPSFRDSRELSRLVPRQILSQEKLTFH